MSSWIETHQTLVRHRKLYQLAGDLGISRTTALGHIVTLWLWALDQAEDGDLTAFPVKAIADAAEWRGRANRFTEALVAAGFVEERDGRTVLHDWEEYTGRLIEQRKAHRARNRTKNCAQSARSLRENCAPTVPNLTVPNLTEPGGDADAARVDARDGLRARAEGILKKRYGRPPSHRDTWRVVELIDRYGVGRVEQAFHEAAALNGRSITYVEKVLATWERDGGPTG